MFFLALEILISLKCSTNFTDEYIRLNVMCAHVKSILMECYHNDS